MTQPNFLSAEIQPRLEVRLGLWLQTRRMGNWCFRSRDPIAALNFCRALAAAMQCDAQPTQDHGQAAQLHVISKEQDGARPLPLLSIVIPVFNEADNLPTLHTRLTDAMKSLGSRL